MRSARRHQRAAGQASEGLVSAMELKDYEFNAHGVELGRFYQSAAIVGDGADQAPSPPGTPELCYQASTGAPSSPPPRLGRRRHNLSTLDLTLRRVHAVPRIAGEAWAAAEKVGREPPDRP